MNAFLNATLALLVAVGLLALVWILFGRLFSPVGGRGGGVVYAVVPAAGDGATLEHDVSSLIWLRGGAPVGFTIVIADGGLNDAGRAVATALLVKAPGMVICPIEQISQYIAS